MKKPDDGSANVTQKEFDVEMATVRKALSVIEEGIKKTASERLRIVSVAKKESTVNRIGDMKK